MKKTRIVKVTRPDATEYYRIERLGWFGWRLAKSKLGYSATHTSYDSARRNMCWFDGTPFKKEVAYESVR